MEIIVCSCKFKLVELSYNTSLYHMDFVFGDGSISVEAETRGKRKVLLMERGIWKI